MKVDGLGGKWTVQLGESGRSKAPKVDGPGLNWTVHNNIKWTVYESGRSKKRKWTVHKKMKLDGPQNCVVNLKTMKVDGP